MSCCATAGAVAKAVKVQTNSINLKGIIMNFLQCRIDERPDGPEFGSRVMTRQITPRDINQLAPN
jgi:hypothetical protein